MRSVMILDGHAVMIEAIPGTDRFAVFTTSHVKMGEIDSEILRDTQDTERALMAVLAKYYTESLNHG